MTFSLTGLAERPKEIGPNINFEMEKFEQN